MRLHLSVEDFEELQDMLLNPPKFIIDGQVVPVCPDRHHTYWHVVRQQVLAELAAPLKRANVLQEEAAKEKRERENERKKDDWRERANWEPKRDRPGGWAESAAWDVLWRRNG